MMRKNFGEELDRTLFPALQRCSLVTSQRVTASSSCRNELQPGGEPDVAAPSFAKLNAQLLLDKMRSADMIVRQIVSEDMDYMFALVSIRWTPTDELMPEKGLMLSSRAAARSDKSRSQRS